MSLSKKNLDKLNSFIKKNNLIKNNHPLKDNNENQHIDQFKRFSKVDNPNNIFYSIIDNSSDIKETAEVNSLLKNNEDEFPDINSNKDNSSNDLSIQDKLYDEFNYLLDE